MYLKKMTNKMKTVVALVAFISPMTSFASDHDDGISPLKPRNRNITDVYAFREDNQTGMAKDSDNLIVIMNSDPRAPSGKQEYFNSNAQYEFNFSKLAASAKNETPTGQQDLRLGFSFGKPTATGHQKIYLRAFHRSNHRTSELITNEDFQEQVEELAQVDENINRHGGSTTTLMESKSNQESTTRFKFKSGAIVEVFAGLREDPFFFDVDQFFKVRAGAAGLGPKVGFRNPNQAVDFTIGYNVNTIAVRIPISMMQAPVLDIWATISVNNKQIERLARPAINEGLILTNNFLNAFNMIPPSADFSAAAGPVRAEAVKVLNAFDMIDGKIDIPASVVVAAFLPDVMRLDTRVPISVGKTAYNADLSGDKGILTGGRKLEDDVMDITLSLLVAGDPTGTAVKDNVSYAGSTGNPNQGHKLLHGQTQRLGPAKFPFVAKPD